MNDSLNPNSDETDRVDRTDSASGADCELDPRMSATIAGSEDIPSETQTLDPGVVPITPETTPERIGRYDIEGVLGAGGFGRVYLARDTNLERRVAIKVPHAHRLTTNDEVEQFLAEARTLAVLDHPGIVPIYDFDKLDDRCYVVSKFIDGETLSQRLQRSSMSMLAAVQLIRELALTLQHVHLQGIVHRDVKPSNLLLTKNNQCYLTDFGLALRDVDYGRKPGQMGTLYYMSPEQARGEAHLVDGRSDLFSLGVVMYEMLTGKRPFTGKNWQEVVTMVCYQEPRPLRQRVKTIPKELERICLKLLSKRANDRFLTAQDVADDLQYFMDEAPSMSQNTPANTSSVTLSSSSSSAWSHSDSRHQLVGIIPRGLRAFDREDSLYFRELLPGPRDRDGIPDSLQFWKRRIESQDAEESFRVGVIYGPSGSGKSSFIKAGLLPLLESRLTVVFIEAASTGTEERLIKALRTRCPDMPEHLDLVESLTWIRRSKGGATARRVLIVIDQLEQWLHSWHDAFDAALAVALRQCDGVCLQCILLVRDDFWLAASRFAEVIEVNLVPSRNLGMIDLFDKRHARKILAEYGRGYARLPDNLADLSKTESQFLDQAIEGLADGDKVIPIQLATFSEIMKGRDWNVKSLQDLGGVKGVGVRFLEESFSAPNSPAQNSFHEKAAQAILRSLLPEAGTNIKGAMKSEEELLSIARYASRPRMFEQVIRILDTELRLITPADVPSDTIPQTDEQTAQSRNYQLTHDSLVPAVRSWLDQRQQLTLTGRAQSRLADRTDVWTARPETRHLPTWFEWAAFLLLTKNSQRDANQRRMMTAANRRHLIGTIISAILIILLWWGGLHFRDRSRALATIKQLTTASNTEVCHIVDQLDDVRKWSREPLLQMAEEHAADTTTGVRARLALLRANPEDETLFNELEQQIATAEIDVLPVLRDELIKSPLSFEYVKRLWETAESSLSTDEDRFRSTFMLATLDPPVDQSTFNRWTQISKSATDGLIHQLSVDPRGYDILTKGIQRARQPLLPHLRTLLLTPRAPATQRQYATNLVIDLFRNDEVTLTDVFLDADDSNVNSFIKALDKSFLKIRPALEAAIAVVPEAEADDDAVEVVCNRKVNAAAMLMRHDEKADLTDLLRHAAIPNTRSGLMERISTVKVPPAQILKHLPTSNDSGIISGLLLTLGTYDSEVLSRQQKNECLQIARTLFTTHPGADVHSAAEWTLRQLGDEAWIRSTIDVLAKKAPVDHANWSVNAQRITMIQHQHEHRLLEIGASEVSIEQLRQFNPKHRYQRKKAPFPDCPAIQVTWFEAVQYCRWLTEKNGMSESDQCYPAASDDNGEMLPYEDFRDRMGYRLATVPELHDACRGMSETRLHFGHNTALLTAYDFILVPAIIHIEQCNRRKPSHMGYFNMLGNVTEWCSPYGSKAKPKLRPIFGGKHDSDESHVVTMLEGKNFASETSFYSVGFRIARTIETQPPGSSENKPEKQ